MSREGNMSSSLPIFQSVNSLLMFVIFLLWHFIMFSSFCTFLLPLFPHVLLQPKALSKPFFLTYPSCLFLGSLTYNQCFNFPLTPFKSFTLLFLTHLWVFCGLYFLVQKSEVLALVFCITSVLLLNAYVYLFICTH